MKIVAALTDPTHAAKARKQGADVIELRVDLYDGDLKKIAKKAKESSGLPVILTLRSAQEGGQFFGTPEEWMAKLAPLLPYADYVDVERQFANNVPALRDAGKKVIASHHSGQMVPLYILFVMERELRVYGDIPKIVVTPQGDEDVIELLSFTQAANKPICTGVMGDRFRHARAMLPLFGSEFVYCHTGVPTAAGQYSVEEFAALRKILGV
ncbi:MAG: 3-dehydroquinate dehydratase [Methanomicrobiales archaeon HGW-Methanomicrobiales-3]|jgi:3-dehydroquinate dehydratase-1|nr:MAG: 3-dehydroquinate dehydratase [Methanomicrobiales archaeon HGW-Methanomicrobiales-3]